MYVWIHTSHIWHLILAALWWKCMPLLWRYRPWLYRYTTVMQGHTAVLWRCMQIVKIHGSSVETCGSFVENMALLLVSFTRGLKFGQPGMFQFEFVWYIVTYMANCEDTWLFCGNTWLFCGEYGSFAGFFHKGSNLSIRFVRYIVSHMLDSNMTLNECWQEFRRAWY